MDLNHFSFRTRALKAVKSALTVEPVMEWLLKHQDDEDDGEEEDDDLEVVTDGQPASTVPLTPEELEARKKAYEEKIRLRRLEKAEEEKREAIEKEKERRKTGAEM